LPWQRYRYLPGRGGHQQQACDEHIPTAACLLFDLEAPPKRQHISTELKGPSAQRIVFFKSGSVLQLSAWIDRHHAAAWRTKYEKERKR
jgi:hypothetical protein